MKLTAQQKSDLISNLTNVLDCNEIVGDYSGRGMFGDKCLGFIYNSEREAILDMMSVFTYEDEASEREILYAVFQNYRTDSMGRGVILYFPTLTI